MSVDLLAPDYRDPSECRRPRGRDLLFAELETRRTAHRCSCEIDQLNSGKDLQVGRPEGRHCARQFQRESDWKAALTACLCSEAEFATHLTTRPPPPAGQRVSTWRCLVRSARPIERLIASAPPDPTDLEELRALFGGYSEALEEATDRVRSTIGIAPSARVKNTGAILEKLERYG